MLVNIYCYKNFELMSLHAGIESETMNEFINDLLTDGFSLVFEYVT